MPHIAAVPLTARLPPFVLLPTVMQEPGITVIAGVPLAPARILALPLGFPSALILVLVLVLVIAVVGGPDGRPARGRGLGGGQPGRQRNGEEGGRHERPSESSDHLDHSSYRVMHQYDP